MTLALARREDHYNIFRWYRAGWGRYTQADPLGVAFSDINPYGYVGGNPVLYVDPTGLVKIRQTYSRRGGLFGGGGYYSLGFGKAYTNGKCVGCGNEWHIELTLMFDHGYYCTGSTACATEVWHATIASAFVAKAAQEYKKYEQKTYSDKSFCEAMAAFYAKSLKDYMMNPDGWPDPVKKGYNNAQQNYEDTHHGWPCGWVPGLCAY